MKNRKPRPISEAQLAANRANAKKSTGPVTPEGKAKVAQNAITHGITSVKPVLSTENEAEFDHLESLLRREFAPRDATEEMLFDEIVEIKWTQRRLRAIEHIQLEISAATPKTKQGFTFLQPAALTAVAYQRLAENSPVLPLLNRQLSRLSREFHRSLKLYLEIHGPLTPTEPQNIAEQNKPISNPESAPVSEPSQPHRPTIGALFQYRESPQPETQPQIGEPEPPRCFTSLAC